MPMLNCSAVTCMYNKNELCSKGDIKVGGKDAASADQTCCESFVERKDGAMSNSMDSGCGCDNVSINCEAKGCVSNQECKCVAGMIDITGSNACRCDETQCASFMCR